MPDLRVNLWTPCIGDGHATDQATVPGITFCVGRLMVKLVLSQSATRVSVQFMQDSYVEHSKFSFLFDPDGLKQHWSKSTYAVSVCKLQSKKVNLVRSKSIPPIFTDRFITMWSESRKSFG